MCSTFYHKVIELSLMHGKTIIITIINVVLAVSLFYAGLHFNKVTEEKKDTNRQIKLKKYFLGLLEIHMHVSMEQAEQYHLTALKLKQIGTDKIMIKPIAGTPHSSILEIDRQDLYEIFVHEDNMKEDTKKYNIIVTGIEYLNSVTQDVKHANAKLKEEYIARANLFNEYNHLVNIEIDKLEENVNSSKEPNKVYSEIIRIWRQESRGLSITYIYQKRIKIILEIIAKHKKDANTAMLYRNLDKLALSYVTFEKLYKEAELSYERTYQTTIKTIIQIKISIE